MSRKWCFAVFMAVIAAALLIFAGCSETPQKDEKWSAKGHEDTLSVQPTAAPERVNFGSYPKSQAAANVASLLNGNVKIDADTGNWTEYAGADGKAWYDREYGFYCYQPALTASTPAATADPAETPAATAGSSSEEATAPPVNVEYGETQYYVLQGSNYFLVEPITWLVLESKDNTLLLITESVIESGLPFHDQYGAVSWADSSMRDWLNGTDEYAVGGAKYKNYWNFYHRAFSEEERGAIRPSVIQTEDHEVYGTLGGGETTDHIYLLSSQEADGTYRIFSVENITADHPENANSTRVVYATPYAVSRGVSAGSKNECTWWLRSPGISTYMQAVYRFGDIGNGYAVNDTAVGIRPVVRVSADAVTRLEAGE